MVRRSMFMAVMGYMDYIFLTSALVVGSAAAYSFPNCALPPLSDSAVCDTALDPITRATALIDLFTVPELISNTVSTSPGVSRLGLPAYQWWSEALVRSLMRCNGRYPLIQL